MQQAMIAPRRPGGNLAALHHGHTQPAERQVMRRRRARRTRANDNDVWVRGISHLLFRFWFDFKLEIIAIKAHFEMRKEIYMPKY